MKLADNNFNSIGNSRPVRNENTKCLSSVADLEVGRAATPSPLSDGLTPSLTVMLAMLNFDRFIVKHGTQNIQNDCHQQLSGSIRVHKIFVFGQGSAPDPTGELTALLQTLSWFKGH